ncbi:MAG: thioredoxin family protein [Candidatus Margulisbacteria bacterium]|nr:thioredoxin family protein [Candidatus Margulisiibacteriota bacterium]
MPLKHSGYMKSFLVGILAAITSTPCTAPFMGTALGVSMTQSPLVTMTIFTSLGLGMASPYLALCIFPYGLKWLPKPGKWMVIFKQVLSIPLFGTVLWLGYVFNVQIGPNGYIIFGLSLCLVTITCLILGRKEKRSQLIKWATIILLITGLGMAAYKVHNMPAHEGVSIKTSESGINWKPYSPSLFTELRQSGRPIFIDVTAAWCLTCKVNEAVTFSNGRVKDTFESMNIVPLKADWTLKSPEVTALIQSHGRNGIPLYIYYSEGSDTKPIILPEILTPSILLKYLNV